MILALEAMDPTLQAVFFAIAFGLFLVAAFGVATRLNLVAAGLAAFAFPWFWNALAAA